MSIDGGNLKIIFTHVYQRHPFMFFMKPRTRCCIRSCLAYTYYFTTEIYEIYLLYNKNWSFINHVTFFNKTWKQNHRLILFMLNFSCGRWDNSFILMKLIYCCRVLNIFFFRIFNNCQKSDKISVLNLPRYISLKKCNYFDELLWIASTFIYHNKI